MSGRICVFLPGKALFSFCLATESYSPRSAGVVGRVADNPENRVKFPATRRPANSCVAHPRAKSGFRQSGRPMRREGQGIGAGAVAERRSDVAGAGEAQE